MWKTPVTIDARTTTNFLFDRNQDPEQQNNLWDSDVDTRNRLLQRLKNLLIEEGCPDEQFHRLDLDSV